MPGSGAHEARPSATVPGLEQQLATGQEWVLRLQHLTMPHRHLAVLGLQHTIGNHAVQRLMQSNMLPGQAATFDPTLAAIQRQPDGGAPPPSSNLHTITDPDAVIRGGPSDFKSTGKTIAVGTRVQVIDTQTATKGGTGSFVNLVEAGTGAAIGWTSRENLGDVQYAKAAASFVYAAKVAPRAGHRDILPIMVYLPPNFDGTKKADIVLYFHGDAADYSASSSDNYGRENPAIGMHLTGGADGSNRLVVAPQGNEWTAGGTAIFNKSPWDTLHAGDYESMIQTALTNLQADLKLQGPVPRGAFSIAGHSGGGKALGQATQDLDKTGDGVKDVTLVEAGYGGGEDRQGDPDGSFARSFQMVRDWLLTGKGDKVLRVLTKAGTAGTDTRRAIEGTAEGRIPVLGLTGVKRAIKASGRDGDLAATATEITTDPKQRTGGMQLIRTIVVSHKGGTTQGTIYVFLMTNPPRGKDVDTHFGVRDATIGDIVGGQGKGGDFASH